jgi:hypothetical protein
MHKSTQLIGNFLLGHFLFFESPNVVVLAGHCDIHCLERAAGRHAGQGRAKGLHAATLFMVASAVLCFGAITARMSAGKCAELHVVASSSMWRWFSGGLPLLLVAAIVLFDGVADGLFVIAQLRLHIAKHVVANHMSVVFGLVQVISARPMQKWFLTTAQYNW